MAELLILGSGAALTEGSRDTAMLALRGARPAQRARHRRAWEVSTGRVCAYGADGCPSPGICTLARDADLLVHEAASHFPGVHSSAEEAAEVARAANAKRLVLIHLAPQSQDLPARRAAAEDIFGGPVSLANDLERYAF